MKRCSISLIRKMQIKITTRYHLTPVRKRMAVSKNKCWQAYGEKGILVNFDKNVNWYNHYRSMKLPQKKIQIKLPYDIAILPLCIYLKKIKTLNWKDICTCIFTAELFIIAKIWTKCKCPLNNE